MKTNFSSNFFSSLSLLLLLLIFCIRCATAQSLIQNTCRTGSKQDANIPYGFCTTSLQAAPASRCASIKGLGVISVRLTRYNLTDTRCYIKQLLRDKDKRLDAYVRACLEDCLQLYSDAIPSIRAAMKYFNGKRFFDVNTQVTAVMDAATTCEDGFQERKGVVSPLTKRNDETFKLSAMVLYIMNVIQTGSN